METVTAKANRDCKDYSGEGFIEISTSANTVLEFVMKAGSNGHYVIDFRYSNRNGPVNTSNKCAMRRLLVNGKVADTIVFPQRGVDSGLTVDLRICYRLIWLKEIIA
jgi:hypothetical protein